MQQKFYRVELNNIDFSKTYCSNDKKYGKSLNFEKYIHFLNVYFSIMKSNNISADFLVTFNNNMFLYGYDYLKEISNAIVNEELIDIQKITNIKQHINQTISISSVNQFVNSFDEQNNFIFFDNGSYLWEYINEAIRLNFFNDKPKRLDSIFLFDNLDSCNYYISNHLHGQGKIYEIELIEMNEFFEADMKIIDNIENQILFEDLVNEFANYWRADFTKEPIKEIIFQGKYKYKNIT
jgi:hypothetical protein